MAAPAILCQNTTITVDDGAASPITINGVVGITGLGSGSATEIDTTTLASSAKEFRQGLQDFGSIDIELIRNQDDDGQAELAAIKASQTTREFVITLPNIDPTVTLNVATFNGFCTQLTADIGADEVVRGNATIRITGEITWS